jgi:transcriptional regulator with XRE-family HTH domain
VFGEAVRAHRLRLSLSQEELAERCGISVRGLRKIENGRSATPRPVTVRVLAEAFELSAGERERFCASALSATAAGARRCNRPAQLPVDVAGFTGRAEEIATVVASLVADVRPTPAIIVVTGTAGVGKTALAVHCAHQVRPWYPDGQLYINLRGFDPTGSVVSPGSVLRWFLDALGVPAARIPDDLDPQVGLYRTLLADRRVLVLLDNARDPEQIRPLLPAAPGCAALVTSRDQLVGLVATDNADPLPLGLLSPRAGGQLLAGRIGTGRASAEPDAVAEIVDRCARLPLALAIAAARAAAQPDLPLAALARDLTDRAHRLDVLATGDAGTDPRSVFSWSHRALSPGAARLFRLLGLHPGPEFAVGTAASLAGMPARRVVPLLAELVRANLVEEYRPGWYALHDLLHAYAGQEARDDPTEEPAAATGRVLAHYLHTAAEADRLLIPARSAPDLDPSAPG